MKTRIISLILLLASTARAQAPLNLETTYNGITQNWAAGAIVQRGQLVTVDSTGRIIPATTGTTSGIFGVAVTNSQNAGQSLLVSLEGSPLVLVDGACVAGNVVTISTTVAGDGHCSALTSASGQVIGYAINTGALGSLINVALSISASVSINTSGLLPTQLIQNGLIADYRILPTEVASALVDYSGNGNNATGCVSTCPVIQPNTGGVQFNGTGAISLPAALNAAQTVQLFVYNTNSNGGWLAGNGTPANSSILLSTVFTQSATQVNGDSALQHNSRVLAGTLAGGTNAYVYPRAITSGNVIITWDAICDTAHFNFDTILINNVDEISFGSPVGNFYVAQGCSQGHQTTGNYQLGGIASCVNYNVCGFINNGTIFWAVFYNRPLAIKEVQQNIGFMTSVMQTTRGVTVSPFKGVGSPNTGLAVLSLQPTFQLAIDGDSLSCGKCAQATPNPVASYGDYIVAGLNATNGVWNANNEARAGFTLNQQLLPFAPIAIDPIFEPYTVGNVVVIWAGTNDTPGTNTVTQLSAYCQARRAVGWKCLPVSMISRTGLDAGKNAYNTASRQLWPTFADGYIDLAADPNLGADGANASAVYFATDHIHVQDVGIINDETPWVQRAINRLYGNHDFSTATVYSSAAAAAVATTAGSEATNTVTLTMAATPANCQINNFVQATGITPAGYNGNWFIRTRSATTISYFAATAGMGAITVQGTISCPQSQDADQYAVLNFGAGNHTLDSCQAYTGQYIYRKNINAAGSTLVPFQASETIDGAANLAIASNQVRILQSQLISPAAAGCTWRVIQ